MKDLSHACFVPNLEFVGSLGGGTPLDAPAVGWMADTFGPRRAMAIEATSGFAAALVAIRYLDKYRGLRIRVDDGRPRLVIGEPRSRPM